MMVAPARRASRRSAMFQQSLPHGTEQFETVTGSFYFFQFDEGNATLRQRL
jgi:hypothetical protein